MRFSLALPMLLVACAPPQLDAEDDVAAETESTDSESTGSDESADFIPVDDNTVVDPCDQYDQDCPEGEKCIWADNELGSACVPVVGDQAPGEPCSWTESLDDCDDSSTCFGDQCRTFCSQRWDPTCPDGFTCRVDGDFNPVCLPKCDPLAQDCVDDPLSCTWYDVDFMCLPEGFNNLTGNPCKEFTDCMESDACMPGFLVPGCMESNCCAPLCNLLDPDCTTLPGSECSTALADMPGLEHVGVCLGI